MLVKLNLQFSKNLEVVEVTSMQIGGFFLCTGYCEQVMPTIEQKRVGKKRL